MATKKKEEEAVALAGTVFTGLFLTFIAVMFVIWIIPNNHRADALRSYEKSVEFCGEDNVREHNYSNGSTDFDCADYSRVE